MTFTLPNLPYAHDALAPYMSKETLEFHHDKHHQAYVTNGNNAIKGTEFEGKSLEEIAKASFGKNPAVFNNAGQHYNHLHFWSWMKPNGGGDKLPGRLEKKITEDLGGLEKFKTDFAAAGVGQFGSGWCWLQVKAARSCLEDRERRKSAGPRRHADLGCDVWETPTTSTTAIAGPTTSRRSWIISSIGITSTNCSARLRLRHSGAMRSIEPGSSRSRCAIAHLRFALRAPD